MARVSKKTWNEIREATFREAIEEVKRAQTAGEDPIRCLERREQCAAWNLTDR